MAEVVSPVAATIAVVVHNDRVLLVRRANPPDAGLWGFPGGKIQAGETLSAAALRELHEETNLIAEAGPVLTTLDALDYAANGQLRHHFILVAVLCRCCHGETKIRAGDDALEARWFVTSDLMREPPPLSEGVLDVLRLALQTGR
ncbi:NUDIX hydrolase [Enterobacillus tribolii]|uniref:8-oxo-dGTP diphosphatase n=1 Tax=Enterobacillus tribolii TaxID=1487935 RepID=A0A370Q6W2_9GAMM|nr:NUDIX hydrolase [Enterobacillus tribolii]MBW7984884.1 NUDIX domain-containing protein [Enterobacillus tribolii]RDK84096.1 8-oxo-dGTP diphosphatase [Enterobacillus tribolii]